ncbi:MAG: HlyC/CorC family transporter [Chloroflexaceae bacterium]|nr:HlyC/CorC family transporter [Chloroflexaceae bacterium]
MVLFSLILACIALYGFFTATEMAMVSVRRGRLQQLADDGSAEAAMVLQLQQDPNGFLSSVQIIITLIATLIGVLSGMLVVPLVTAWLQHVSVLSTVADSVSVLVLVLVLTYLLLVFGEFVPKRLALQQAEGIALRLARMMQVLAVLWRPVVLVLTASTNMVLRVLGYGSVPVARVTEEDIRHLVRQGTEEGSVKPQEQELIEGIFRFGDRSVRQIMTPRRDVSALDAEQRLDSLIDAIIQEGFSRFPVYEENLDQIVGVTHVRNMLQMYHFDNGHSPIRATMFPALFVPEHIPATSLLPLFRRSQQHLAIVLNELGTFEGIVTLEDVLEEIVGDIADENDQDDESTVITYDDGSRLIDGTVSIDQVKAYLEIDALPEEAFYRFDTLAGFVISLFGHIPVRGESVVWNAWRFEVVAMDGLRIDKVLIIPEPEQPEEIE